VNPIFTWVRLAQRIPVRIELEAVPEGVVLVAGMAATVEVQPDVPASFADEVRTRSSSEPARRRAGPLLAGGISDA